MARPKAIKLRPNVLRDLPYRRGWKPYVRFLAIAGKGEDPRQNVVRTYDDVAEARREAVRLMREEGYEWAMVKEVNEGPR